MRWPVSILFILSLYFHHKPIWANVSKKSSGFIADSKGNFWFVDGRPGLKQYNPKTGFYKSYGEKEGMVARQINGLLEDNQGVLWIATADGVLLYDGMGFRPLPIQTIKGEFISTPTRYDSNYGNSINPENGVNCMLLDSKGNVWLGLQKSIFCYDGKIFKPLTTLNQAQKTIPFKLETDGMGVESIVEDPQGKLWFGGRGLEGVYRFDGSEVLQYVFPRGTSWVYPIMATARGEVWFNSVQLYRFSNATFEELPSPVFIDWAWQVVIDHSGAWWLNTGENWGITQYKRHVFRNYTAKDCAFMTERNYIQLLADGKGKLWILAKNGEMAYFRKGKFYRVNYERSTADKNHKKTSF